MQTTLRIDDEIYRVAKAEAARQGETLTRFIEEALRERIARSSAAPVSAEVRKRDRLMEAMLKRTAHFRVGRKPTRNEMNERYHEIAPDWTNLAGQPRDAGNDFLRRRSGRHGFP